MPALARNVLRTAASSQTRATTTAAASATTTGYIPSSQLCSSFLLQYLLSDLSPERMSDCDQLHGLPILPLATHAHKDKGLGGPGHVGRVAVYNTQQVASPPPVTHLLTVPSNWPSSSLPPHLSPIIYPQATAISEVCSLGFSASRAIWALSRTSTGASGSSPAGIPLHFEVSQALELLTSANAANTNTPPSSLQAQASSPSQDVLEKVFVLASEEEMQVFGHRGQANSVLIDLASLPFSARDFFVHRNMQAHSNLRSFHASLVPDLLRLILPGILFDNNNNNNNGSSSSTVACSSTSKEGSAVLAFLPHFWRFVASREEIVSIIADGPALVPSVVYPPDHNTIATNSNELKHDSDGQNADLPLPPIVNLSPLSRMQGLIAPRKGDQQLPPHILTTLQRIGVRAIYPRLLSETVESGTICTGFWSYVCVPTRAGVIAAIDATIRTQLRERKSTLSTAAAGMMGVEGLSGEQREALRGYLSTCESVAHLTDSECAILRGLPLYRVCREDKGYPRDEGKGSDMEAKGYVAIGSRTAKGLGSNRNASSRDVGVLFDASPSRPYCTLRQLDAPALSRGSVLLAPHMLTHTQSEPSDLALLERLGASDPPRATYPINYHDNTPMTPSQYNLSSLFSTHSINSPNQHIPGVQVLPRSEFFRSEVLSRLPLLLGSYPAETERALVLMLEEMKALCDEDDTFMTSLRETAFLTTAAPPRPSEPLSSSASSWSQSNPSPSHPGASLAVYRACDLFDPQVDITPTTHLQLTPLERFPQGKSVSPYHPLSANPHFHPHSTPPHPSHPYRRSKSWSLSSIPSSSPPPHSSATTSSCHCGLLVWHTPSIGLLSSPVLSPLPPPLHTMTATTRTFLMLVPALVLVLIFWCVEACCSCHSSTRTSQGYWEKTKNRNPTSTLTPPPILVLALPPPRAAF